MNREFIDADGLTASQFRDLFGAQKNYSPELQLILAYVSLAVEDHINLLTRGHVSLDASREYGRRDALDNYKFLFSESYGVHEPDFLTLRECCLILDIDIYELRKYLRTFGGRSELNKIVFRKRNTYKIRTVATRRTASRVTKEAA